MIYRSSQPDIAIPTANLHDFVLRHADRLASKPALIDAASGRTLTYGDLKTNARRVAAGLAARGLGKGDVLGVYCPNVPEYAVILMAVSSLGGICTTVNPLYTADELANQLNDCRARFLVTVPAFLEKAQAAADKSAVEEVFVLGEAAGATPFAALTQAGEAVPAVSIDPAKDLVVLPYSSGTTGLPKGVMLTHRNLVANLAQTIEMEAFDGYTEADVVLAVLPFFHIYGMVVVMQITLAQGGTLVTMPRFDMEEFLGAVQKYRITIAPLVPPIVLGLAKSPVVDKFDLSSLRLIVCGAAPVGPEVAKEAARRIGCKLGQGYGMTEASPVTHLSPTRTTGYDMASAGVPVPNTEVTIIDPESGRPAAPGAQGELWMRGPQIMQGYLGRPDATAQSIDAEGWYHTGDIGYADEKGNFYVVDRLKELIKYKGLQVAPAELEALVLTHAAVADVAVIPSPDEEAGEIPKAFVVLKPGQQVTAEAIMEFVAAKVAPHKRIRLLEFTQQIPKSASGKILRRVLVDQERQQRAG